MNFFTANEAFSLYPYASFVQKVTILFGVQKEHDYAQRGFMPQTLAATKPHISYCPQTVRRPGDEHTWKIKMSPVVCGPVAPVESNTWKVCTIPGTQYGQTVYEIFDHPKLRLSVVTVDIASVRRWFGTKQRTRRNTDR